MEDSDSPPFYPATNDVRNQSSLESQVDVEPSTIHCGGSQHSLSTANFDAEEPLTAADENHPPLWTSFWLKKTTLLGFTAIFTSLWISLAILWHYNIQSNGFPLTLSSNSYTWTYGPTAVLTIIVGLWRQVDYHCKLLQPWKAMKKSPEVPTKSVLLDYISPLQVLSIWRAAKNRHWAVVLTVVGFTLLKAIIVVSTTLLISSPIAIRNETSITLDSKFDGSEFLQNLKTIPVAPVGTTIGEAYPYPVYLDITVEPVHRLLGILNDELQPPYEILNDTVIQAMHLTKPQPDIMSVSAMVDTFMPNISCESATAILTLETSDRWPTIVALDSDTCSTTESTALKRFSVCGKLGKCPEYRMAIVNCSEPQSQPSSSESIIDSESVPDSRYVLLSINTTTDISKFTRDDHNTRRPTAIICKNGYNI
ncbi:hypothetical protein F5Y08DRAFT_11538 [Xylaria arbuscula]|nr:hypothetical protein F5Y08DRAFT_11538 [Xylaria arbuscula]